MKRDRITIGVLAFVFVGIISSAFAAEPKWVVYEGFDGPGKGFEIAPVEFDPRVVTNRSVFSGSIGV